MKCDCSDWGGFDKHRLCIRFRMTWKWPGSDLKKVRFVMFRFILKKCIPVGQIEKINGFGPFLPVVNSLVFKELTTTGKTVITYKKPTIIDPSSCFIVTELVDTIKSNKRNAFHSYTVLTIGSEDHFSDLFCFQLQDLWAKNAKILRQLSCNPRTANKKRSVLFNKRPNALWLCECTGWYLSCCW